MTDEKSLKLLEFDKITEHLAGHAETDGGRARCRQLRPTDDLITAQEWLDYTEAALHLYNLKGTFTMTHLPDLADLFRRIRVSGLLSAQELYSVARVLDAARRLRAYRGEEATVLDDYFDRLRPEKVLEDRIRRSFNAEGEVLDTASDELYAIRRKKQNASGRVREALNKLIHSNKYQKVLQEPVITQRSGRFVVPVKAEHKGEVSGLVHDVSASGQTLFIEPSAVVEANNEIRLLEGKEQHEIERILQDLSALAASQYDLLEEDYDILMLFDFLFAKAKYAVAVRGSRPSLNDDGVVELRRARHPLIPADRVVAVDITLGEEYDTLVITGPNTGGKTVSLKTLGLLSCMASAGLLIPVADGSKACVFDRIFSDVGDEQSIEQSLSTFSGHMTNVIAIINEVTWRSLCLFDELCAGTDPVEGAALSVAILEHIRKKGARILCTTHYPELKVYALQTAGVKNASCEFDVATLRPTYRLITGMPGRSNAFAISEKLGLSPEIIESAATHLTADDIAFEELLARIDRDRQQTERMRDEAETALRQAKEANAKAQTKAREMEEKLNRDYEQARGEGKRVVSAARTRIDGVIAELEDLIKQKERADFKQKVGEFKNKSRAALKELDDEIDPVREQKTEYELPRPLKIGDTVEVVGVARAAKVVTLPDKKGKLRVSTGSMSFDVKVDTVRLIKPPKEKKPYMPTMSSVKSERGVGSEIQVLGMTVAEMEPEVVQFIDRAVMTGIPSVTIVHGKGTGALRSAVWDILRLHPNVANMRLGKYGEGDSGVTIVELKR